MCLAFMHSFCCFVSFSFKMAAKLIKGEKPVVFQLEENGERLMIGSQVGHSLSLVKGALYKKFPSLWRRCVTSEERQLLSSIGISYSNLSNANIMLVKATEVEDLLKGNVDNLRIRTYSPNSSPKTPSRLAQKALNRPYPSPVAFRNLQIQPSAESSAIHLSGVAHLTTSPNPKIRNLAERNLRRKRILPFLR